MKKMKTMTEGVIWKEILFFAIPLILVDSIIVGNYVGSNALAAVGSSGAIINLLIGFCIGASTGAGVVISQFYGAKNTKGVRKAVHTTMAIALVAGVLLGFVYDITKDPIAAQNEKAKQEAYIAQQSAEQTRAELEKATQTADVIVKAQISKQQAEIEAEAQAEVVRRKAKGEADAIFAKMEAEAKGNQEILTKQAEGMRKLVEAAGGDANAAVKLIVADKLEELISIQEEAIKNIKIDKITVWDTGAGADGKGSTANFLSGLMQSVPPLDDLFKQAGMSLPDFLGEDIQEALKKSQEEAVKRAAEADNAETLDPKDVEVIEPEK